MDIKDWVPFQLWPAQARTLKIFQLTRLVVVLKVSGTMQAADVQPSRLERAKHKLRDLLEARKGLSTGLIAYSGSAHLVMPLTRDERIIPLMLGELTPDLMPVDGDALAAALLAAQRVLQRADTPGSVLVITDGVSDAQAAAVAALDYPVPVQFLEVQVATAKTTPAMASTADVLGANVERLSADERDVQRIARRAQRLANTTPGEGAGGASRSEQAQRNIERRERQVVRSTSRVTPKGTRNRKPRKYRRT